MSEIAQLHEAPDSGALPGTPIPLTHLDAQEWPSGGTLVIYRRPWRSRATIGLPSAFWLPRIFTMDRALRNLIQPLPTCPHFIDGETEA